MENASDALVMAGQILIFLIALTVCISSFTTLRADADRIIGETEIVRLAKGSEGYINYVESRNNGSVRVVGADTVISSIDRGIKENYVIYMKLNNYDSIGSTVTTTTATQNVTINGNQIISIGDKIIKFTIGVDTNQNVKKVLKDDFFDKIKDSTFNEYLGEYQNASEVTSENKQTKRIITYIENL